MRRSVVAVCCLGFFPFTASALGLGDIALVSGLNEPFYAEIPVESFSATELTELEVGLASRETFDRYGLELPLWMRDFNFAVVDEGAPVIRVTSLRPVAEPFVTLLLDIRWGSGRLLREYTVLLDPPLFESVPVQPAVAPAQTGAGEPDATAGAVSRTAPSEPVAAPAVAPVAEPVAVAPAPAPVAASPQPAAEPATKPAQPASPPAPVAAAGSEYRVQRRDTLWGIADRVRGDSGLTINQVMLALYRANPEAFLSNINRLKAGAILRVPETAELGARSPEAATVEVSQQYSEFNNAATEPALAPAEPARLTLVAPAQDTADPAATDVPGDNATSVQPAQQAAAAPETAAQSAAAAETVARIAELETDLADSKRALEVRDAELAALQARIAELEQQAAVTPAPAGEAPVFADDIDAGDESPAETATAAPAAENPAAVAPAPAEQASFIGQLLTSLWFWISAAVVLLLALFVARRNKGEGDTADDWAAVIPPEGEEPADDDMPAFDDSIVVEEQELTPEATQEVRALIDERAAEAARLGADDADAETPGEETTEFPSAPVAAAPAADGDDAETPLEKTISTGGAVDLDSSDPIAEAEFHMAYGLYDQAADLLEKALDEDPANQAYRVKLIEVFFVWENRDGFLRHAQALRDSIGDEADSEWNKVVILGKQLCPDEALFSGDARALSTSDVVDLELPEAGAEDETELDFTLAGKDAEELNIGSDADVLDFDLGDDADAGSGDSDTTMQASEVAGGDTVEAPTLEASTDIGETAEMTSLRDGGFDEGDAEPDTGGADDLDIDLAGFADGLDDEEEDLTSMLSAEQEETLLADPASLGNDDSDADLSAELESEIEAELAGDTSDDDDPDVDLAADLEAEIDAELGIPDEAGEDTVEQPGAAQVATDETLEHSVLSEEVDFDLGLDDEEQDQDDSGEDDVATAIAEVSLPEDATMTEVGTKLDLARAYIDMGDPDGARSILNEVLDEGADEQLQEARQLLEELGD